MMLNEVFDQLFQSELSLDLIPDIIGLQEEFKKAKDLKNYYLCTNKIIDIYIAFEKLDAALEVALDLHNKINYISYPEIYKSLIDNLIYIYITKQHFQKAYTYCMIKKDFIDNNNKEEVNRWYLELAHINEAFEKHNQALSNLESIIENEPSDEIKAFALSNIIKLYIDANDLDKAKAYLVICIDFVNSIGDIEGVRYCNYLKSLILRKENNIKEAKKVLASLFKDTNELIREDFIYLNEYISVLIENNDIKDAFNLCEKYYNDFDNSDDLLNKSAFYRNCLKIDLASDMFLKRKKKNIDSSNVILEKMNEVDSTISSNKDLKNFELNEDEMFSQEINYEKKFNLKILNALEDIKINNSDLNIRAFLMNYSSSINIKILFEEIHFIILNKQKSQIIPDILSNNMNFSTYVYKNNRLYERTIPFNNIMGTLVEEMLSGKDEIIYSFDNTFDDVINPINLSTYNNSFKELYAVSLKNNENVYGVCIYLSNKDILNSYSKTVMNLSSKLLSLSLNDLYIKTNNLLQYNLLNTCNMNENSGIFYYNVNEMTYILSKEAMKILSLNDNIITNEKFLSNVNKKDYESYLERKNNIDEEKPYDVTYHITNNKLIKESASLFTTPTEKYYCGKISEVVLDETLKKEYDKSRLLGVSEFMPLLESLKKKELKIIAIKTDNEVFSWLKANTLENVYYVNETYIIVSEKLKPSEGKKLLKRLCDKFKNEFISCTLLEYPNALVRLDDLLGLVNYMLSENGIIEFTNSLYASYISQSTITECVDKAILKNNITLTRKNLLFKNQLVGEFISPNVFGVYNNESLEKISNNKYYELDRFVLSKLSQNKLYLYKLRSYSLLKLLQDTSDKNVIYKDNVKIIFDISDSDYINDIIKLISNTNHKLIISNSVLKAISIECLVKYSKVIGGYNEIIDDEMYDLVKKFNDEVYYYGPNGFNIGEIIK